MPDGKKTELTENKQRTDGVWDRYRIPVLVGIVGGIVTTLLWMLATRWIYQTYLPILYSPNFYFNTLPQKQIFLIFLLGSLCIGFGIVRILISEIKKIRDALLVGFISGTLSGFAIVGSTLIYKIIVYNNFVTIPAPLLDYFVHISPTIVLSILFQIIGAICGYLWYREKGPSIISKNDVPLYEILVRPVSIALILMLLFIILPPEFSPLIQDRQLYKCKMFQEKLEVERLDNDTLKITQLSANSPEDCLSDKSYTMKLTLNGKDVSDLTIIRKQNLAVTIDPQEGLEYANGSTVVLKGPDVSNSMHIPQLQITKYMQSDDGSLTTLSVIVDKPF